MFGIATDETNVSRKSFVKLLKITHLPIKNYKKQNSLKQ